MTHRRRNPTPRLLKRIKRFTSKGEDVWVCTAEDVAGLEEAIEKIDRAMATGIANGLRGAIVEAIMLELDALYSAAKQ